ncbi:MAG: hypothetical protein FJ297_09650 [Planctomycetes bacterium]|nr:hypothetical protein [Planctomycetota bacterium]
MAKRRADRGTGSGGTRRAKAARSVARFPSGSSVRLVPASPEVAYARAELAFEKYAEPLRGLPGVLSVDIGLRYVGRRATGEFAVRVHVARKLPEAELPEPRVPRQLDGVPVDVIARRFHAGRAVAERSTVVAGGSIAPHHRPSMYGTMGLALLDGLDPARERWITCAHVVTGDRPTGDLARERLPVVDSGQAVVARSLVDRWAADERLDAAVLEPESTAASGFAAGMPRPKRIGALTRQDVIDRVALLKYGASTGLSVGEADSVQSLPIPIHMPDGSVLWVRGQVQIRATDGRAEFAAPGDSGAAVLRAGPRGEYEWVAVLRAVDDQGFGIACHADRVAARLGVVL